MKENKFKFVLKNEETGDVVITRAFTLEECLEMYSSEQVNESLENCDNNASCMMNGYCECPSEYSRYKIVDKLQYIGLKDKKNKEIYEGNIVSDGINTGVVYFDQKKLQYRSKHDEGHTSELTLVNSGETNVVIVGHAHKTY